MTNATIHHHEAMLTGTPASAGKVRGVAHVLGGGATMRPVEAGEILVVDALNDSVMPLAEVAAGVVTEVGGPLSHGATRMRELARPTVMAVQHAVDEIADGEIIEVDAARGVVRHLN
jgi:phosphohistidine swiveling domain-containing protein